MTVVILTEKSSAAKNFAKALGGMVGTFDGESYEIVHAAGHLYEYVDPNEMVDPDKESYYKYWNLENLPWNPQDLSWKRRAQKDAPGQHYIKDVMSKLRSTLKNASELVIATDVDPTGEGGLIAWEIFDEMGVATTKKISRMFFVDESPKSITKAFKERKVLNSMQGDPEFRMADFRSKFDFLSMQWTRIVSKVNGTQGFVIRQGRLKSAMVRLVGDQLKAINEYKKVPFYERRFKDENGVVYISEKEQQYKTQGEVPGGLHASDVVKDSATLKKQAPPKLLDLAGLSSILASGGAKASQVLKVYQSMYEKQIVSYPRTEDKTITKEQFNELLPHVNKIAEVVGVDVALLTHMQPRPTHVKDSGAHGANRPGPNVPNSLDELRKDYGELGVQIYVILAKNYLAMLAPDYEYEAQVGHIKDFPDFIGKTNVPKFAGYKAVFDANKDDKEDEDESSVGLGTRGEPFVHEGFPKKPTWPTMKWLMKQLETRDVGTGATRTSTYAEVTAKPKNIRIKALLEDKRGKITMTEWGERSYQLIQGSNIADLTLTEQMQRMMREIASGSMSCEQGLATVAPLVEEDLKTIMANAKTLGGTSMDIEDKVTGTLDGKSFNYSRMVRGYRLTDEEVETLNNGGEVMVSLVSSKGTEYKVGVKLGYWSPKDEPDKKIPGITFGTPQFDNPDRVKTVFEGKEVSYKKETRGHKFTNEEIEKLNRGEEITITCTGSNGEYTVTGKLGYGEFTNNEGKKIEYFGFIANERQFDDSDRVKTVFEGKEVSYKRETRGHRFTDEEIEKLNRGEEITIECISGKGSKYMLKGKLGWGSYNGNRYFGFQGEFAN